MDKIIKVFDILFGSYIQDLVWHITAISQALVLFFGGIAYGNAPIDMKFTCDIPSAVYEYEACDTVHIHATAENIGRPFKEYSMESIRFSVYRIENGEYISPYVPYTGPIPDGQCEYFVKHGDILENDFRFIIRDDAPKGTYTIKLISFGDEEVFENAITIK